MPSSAVTFASSALLPATSSSCPHRCRIASRNSFSTVSLLERVSRLHIDDGEPGARPPEQLERYVETEVCDDNPNFASHSDLSLQFSCFWSRSHCTCFSWSSSSAILFSKPCKSFNLPNASAASSALSVAAHER